MRKLYVILIASMLVAFPLTACSRRPMSEEESVESGSIAPKTPNIFDVPSLIPSENGSETKNEAPISEEEPSEEPQPIAPAVKQYIRIACNGLNVRSGAGTSYATLGQVEKDVLLPLEEKSGNWYKTYYKNKTAYVSADAKYTSLYTLEAGEDTVEKVIAEGTKLLGTPYVYGAVRLHDGKGNMLKNFTTGEFDCSSLMQYIFYYGAGVRLDVTTRTQIKQGTHVAKTDLRRGDLMFFTNASRKNLSGIERVGHVALYLGDNYILHTASDYAKIEQISSTRWSYFIEARRVL